MKKIAIVSVLACVSALALAGLGSFRSEARAAAPVAVAPVALPPVVDFAPLAITLPETTIAATPKARKAPNPQFRRANPELSESRPRRRLRRPPPPTATAAFAGAVRESGAAANASDQLHRAASSRCCRAAGSRG